MREDYNNGLTSECLAFFYFPQKMYMLVKHRIKNLHLLCEIECINDVCFISLFSFVFFLLIRVESFKLIISEDNPTIMNKYNISGNVYP